MRKDLRCSKCDKKLAVVDMTGIGHVETKCPRCGCVDNHEISLVPSSQYAEGHRSPSTSTERRRV